MAHHTDLGKKGEDIAFHHLLNNGYTINARNWRFNNAEIDIIATKDNVFIIVEVKTRSAAIFEEARDAITDQKIRFLTNAAEAYILENEIDQETRFDVIMIKWFGDEKYEVTHIIDAFTPLIG